MVRRHASDLARQNIAAIEKHLHLYHADVTDAASVAHAVRDFAPDELYHLAAQSHVLVSFKSPEGALSSTLGGTLNILEACRLHAPDARIYIAGSSEQFGGGQGLHSRSPMHPRSPYAVGKLAAHRLSEVYGASYGLGIVRGIAFNHESPRRSLQFLTRKVAHYVALAARGRQGTSKLLLGNPSAVRDWGWAPEYVRGFHAAMQSDQCVCADGVIFATGVRMSVREFAQEAFAVVGLDAGEWVEWGTDAYLRPWDVNYLHGNPLETEEVLGWKAEIKGTLLVRKMVEAELDALG